MGLTKRCFIYILKKRNIGLIIDTVIYTLICLNYSVKTLFSFLSPNQNILKCADVYKISEQMLKDRDRYWTVQYRYFSGDILLTVSYPDTQATCVYVSKR